MRPITASQAEVLRTITDLAERQGYPPTVREIGDDLGGRSTCVVQRHLEALERKGYITREPRKARTIRVLRMSETALQDVK